MIESEFGVPIPGEILPRDRWTSTALKRLPQDEHLEWHAVFGRDTPVVIDLGCGNGRFVLQSAVRRPEMSHLGVDVLPVVVRYATRRANQRGLSNVRFAVKDAQTLARTLVRPQSVAEFHLYHPQPYHAQRDSRKRVFTPEFLADLHRALAPSGVLVVQTDEPAYWRYIRTIAPHFFAFREQAGPWPDAPEGRTRREILARQRGLPIFRGIGVRRDDLGADALNQLVRTLPRPIFRTSRASAELDHIEREQTRGGRSRHA